MFGKLRPAGVDGSDVATSLCEAASEGRAADIRALSAEACVDGRNAEVRLRTGRL